MENTIMFTNDVFEAALSGLTTLPAGPEYVAPARCPLTELEPRRGFELAHWHLAHELPLTYKGQKVRLNSWRWEHHFERGGLSQLRSKVAGDLASERRRILGPSLRDLRERRQQLVRELAAARNCVLTVTVRRQELERSLRRLREERFALAERVAVVEDMLNSRYYDWADHIGESWTQMASLTDADIARINARNARIRTRLGRVRAYHEAHVLELSAAIRRVERLLWDAPHISVAERDMMNLEARLKACNQKIAEKY